MIRIVIGRNSATKTGPTRRLITGMIMRTARIGVIFRRTTRSIASSVKPAAATRKPTGTGATPTPTTAATKSILTTADAYVRGRDLSRPSRPKAGPPGRPALLISKSLHRIYPGRPSCRKVTRQQRASRQEPGDSHERDRIQRTNPVKHHRHQPRGRCAKYESDRHT